MVAAVGRALASPGGEGAGVGRLEGTSVRRSTPGGGGHRPARARTALVWGDERAPTASRQCGAKKKAQPTAEGAGVRLQRSVRGAQICKAVRAG
ncbi:hypothetical protein GUJ93_ZPchr0014g46789 [Zizania palustris]|uniref:Uncharacterized protein n=1 Tax=Zizania palustris TaxID=103762 RepID=A0A8J5SVM3_ZIZPA|nr:hypothetical protein GUJ93_ZPchr0014g46789 [Zizania palustris]